MKQVIKFSSWGALLAMFLPLMSAAQVQALTCPVGSTKFRLADNVADSDTTKKLTWPTAGAAGPYSYTFGATGITVDLRFSSLSYNQAGYPVMATGLKTARSHLLSDHGIGTTVQIPGGSTLSKLNITINVPVRSSAVSVWDVDSIKDGGLNTFRDMVRASDGASLTAGTRVTVAGLDAVANVARSLSNSCQLDDARCDVNIAWGTSNTPTTRTIEYISGNAANEIGTHQAIGYNNFEFCITRADLSVKKGNNGVTADSASDSVVKGQMTTYTIEVSNNGPDPISDAVVKDSATQGLSNCAVMAGSLSSSGTVSLPTPAALTYAALSGAGVQIPSMSANSTLTFKVQCTVN